MATTRQYYLEYSKSAHSALLENCPKWESLISQMDQFISCILSVLKNISTVELEHKYRLTLITSFIRSHFVILDLIESSDLIEAATIIRKQVELLARFEEIEKKELTKLMGKTPKVTSLNIGPTYGSLSEIAHSSKFGPLSLLGIQETEKETGYSIYPVFNENTLTTISIYCDVFCKFAAAMLQYDFLSQSKEFNTISIEILNNLIEEGVKSNISYFENWKVS